MTTEKDAVRVGERPTSVPWAFLPMRAAIEPDLRFGAWLSARLASARAGSRERGAPQP
jgi:hypothetical protein